jgi:hypothetical protein
VDWRIINKEFLWLFCNGHNNTTSSSWPNSCYYEEPATGCVVERAGRSKSELVAAVSPLKKSVYIMISYFKLYLFSSDTFRFLSLFRLPAMQGRPSSSRPSTSARPTTAFDRVQQRLQQWQPHEIAEEEYGEDSDDEDVFAFLPPTTADQDQQSTSPSPFAFAAVPFPEPTFDPWDRQYPISPPAAPIPPNIPSEAHSHPHPYNQPPPVSPSTDSHPSTGMSGPDFYRLKSLGTAATSKLAVVEDFREQEDDEKKGVDSQSNPQSQSQTYHQCQQQHHHAGPGVLGKPLAASSLADSLSVTQSILEDDESRSIK